MLSTGFTQLSPLLWVTAGAAIVVFQVVDASSKVHLHLKTKRGSKVEEHKVEMHCNPDGKWILRSLLT